MAGYEDSHERAAMKTGCLENIYRSFSTNQIRPAHEDSVPCSCAFHDVYRSAGPHFWLCQERGEFGMPLPLPADGLQTDAGLFLLDFCILMANIFPSVDVNFCAVNKLAVVSYGGIYL
jgi:hypothetical protein